MTDSQSSACLNCGVPLEGKFCAACGQRDIPPYPSVRELASDAVSEFSGWDGRLWATVRALVRRPGLLTREFLAGRRARYISPVRLYVSASVIYFLIAANAPNLRLESGETLGLQIKPTAGDSVATATSSRARRIGNLASGSLESGEAATPEEREAALRDIAAAPPLMRPFLRRAILDPGGFRRGLAETMPKMLFVLLPLFAGIVAIFFRGRKYPEHLYFAIHLHAFVFLALSVIALIRFTGIPVLAAAAGITGILWILVHATLAFRRVYRDSIGRVILKELGIAAIYSVVAFIGFALTIYWVSIAG